MKKVFLGSIIVIGDAPFLVIEKRLDCQLGMAFLTVQDQEGINNEIPFDDSIKPTGWICISQRT